MRLVKIGLALCLVLFLAPNPLAIAQNVDLTAESVKESIRKGVNYLKSNAGQADPSFPSGLAALKALALLNAGVPPNDPALAGLIRRVRNSICKIVHLPTTTSRFGS